MHKYLANSLHWFGWFLAHMVSLWNHTLVRPSSVVVRRRRPSVVVVRPSVVVRQFLSTAISQTWINGSLSYLAQLWYVIGPWCTSSKILVRSKMAPVRPILDFIRMDLSIVSSQYLIMWPEPGYAWTLSKVAYWCMSSKILAWSKMAAVGPIIDFVRMDLSVMT